MAENEVRPPEFWMYGRECSVGVVQYWKIHHEVLRRGEWVPEVPYTCGTREFADSEAFKMANMTSSGRHLYRDVRVTGPYEELREVWWIYKDDECVRGPRRDGARS